MKTLLSCLLVSTFMLSGIFSVFAESTETKSTCKRCRLGSTAIVVICDGPVKDAKLRLNCKSTGWISMSCYDWRGDLETGENLIPLARFTTEEGKKFNPNEYAVRTLIVTRNRDTSEWSQFDWTKDK